jgi:hypothetical protein
LLFSRSSSQSLTFSLSCSSCCQPQEFLPRSLRYNQPLAFRLGRRGKGISNLLVIRINSSTNSRFL